MSSEMKSSYQKYVRMHLKWLLPFEIAGFIVRLQKTLTKKCNMLLTLQALSRPILLQTKQTSYFSETRDLKALQQYQVCLNTMPTRDFTCNCLRNWYITCTRVMGTLTSSTRYFKTFGARLHYAVNSSNFTWFSWQVRVDLRYVIQYVASLIDAYYYT